MIEYYWIGPSIKLKVIKDDKGNPIAYEIPMELTKPKFVTTITDLKDEK